MELLIILGKIKSCLFRYVIEKGRWQRDKELIRNHQAITAEINSCLLKWGRT